VADRMTSKTPLRTNGFLESKNGKFRLRLEKSGNLILTRLGSDGKRKKYWETKTGSIKPAEHRPVKLVVGPDGRLRLFDSAREVRWRTVPRNSAWTEAVLILKDDGNLVELSSPRKSKPIWASGTPSGTGKVGGVGVVRPPSDRSLLRQGQALKAGDELLSANGMFKLAMQTDGNLVLYSKSGDGSWHPYWDTGTWSLPATERPTKLVLTAQAELHLLDDAAGKRWGSGTWGEGYINPFLSMQDDGNLVMYHDTWRAYWATGTPSRMGVIGPRGHRPGTQDLDDAVNGFGRLPAVVVGSTDISSSESHVGVNGVDYAVTSVRRRLVNQIVDQAFMQDQAELGVWPGQIIQGAPLLASDVASIPGFPRRPGTVEVVTNLVATNPGAQSRTVTAPTAAKVNAARREILQAIRPSDSAGIVKVDAERASTYNEFSTKFGFHVKGAAFGVEGNLDLNGNYKETTAVLVVRQVFYTTTFTPSGPGASGLWDEQKMTYDDLEPYAHPGNPPLFVDSVSYGRFICVSAQGAHSSNDLTAALKGSWTATVSGDADLTVKQKQILESSRLKVYTIGVPGRSGFQSLADPVAELDQVYRAGLQFSVDSNPGAMVSFTARHIADNTLARVGMVADFVQPVRAVGVDVNEAFFEVWDGPMGGNRPTGISVNPGDVVSIHADGRISSGIFLSEPHGPDGWIGHRSGNELPVPGPHPPYGLIHRYGGGSWMLTNSQFSRAVGATEGSGPIMLGINDNNPFNGSSRDKWRVWVSVKRVGAGSVGIYI
jgi:hypothetical protein